MGITHEENLIWNWLISGIESFDVKAAKDAGCDMNAIAHAAGKFLQKFANEADVFKSSSVAQKQYSRLTKRAQDVLEAVVPVLTREQKDELVSKAAEAVRPGVSFTGGSRSIDTDALGFPKGKRARGDRG